MVPAVEENRRSGSGTRSLFRPWDTLADGASSTALRRQTATISIVKHGGREFATQLPASCLSMMKAAKPGPGDHRRGRRRLAFHWPSIRRVLI